MQFNHFTVLVYHHKSVLPKGRSFTANSGTKTAVLPKRTSSTAHPRTMVADSLGMNRCGSFPIAFHTLLSSSFSASCWSYRVWIAQGKIALPGGHGIITNLDHFPEHGLSTV